MNEIELYDPATFGRNLLETYLKQGFQSLTKRDVDLLIFVLLELDGAIDRSGTNYAVARQLRLTPARVKALRRDGYARWRPLIGDDRRATLKRILTSVLTGANIDAGAKHAAEKTRKEGFLAVRIEHPDDKEEFEQAILDCGGIPIYERNPDVLAVRFESLLVMSERMDFIVKDPKKVRAALKKLAPTAEAVDDILRKDLSDLTWSDARAALNSVGVSAVTGTIEAKITDLLKLVFPFLA